MSKQCECVTDDLHRGLIAGVLDLTAAEFIMVRGGVTPSRFHQGPRAYRPTAATAAEVTRY